MPSPYLLESIPTNFLLNPTEQKFGGILIEILKYFLSRKFIWKYRLQNELSNIIRLKISMAPTKFDTRIFSVFNPQN